MQNFEFVGIINKIISNNSIYFVANEKAEIMIDNIVCYNAADAYVLCKIVDIDINYYLKEPDSFFISKASHNELENVADNESIKYSKSIKAQIIGRYLLNNEDQFIKHPFSTNYNTPQNFTKIYKVPYEYLINAFCLSNIEDSIDIGVIAHPYLNKPAAIDFEMFTGHTFISGTTGAGKSRLVAHITKQIALNNGHVTIIDPHDEYTSLVFDDKLTINRFSRSKRNLKNHLLKINSKVPQINLKNLQFGEKELTASMLVKLLPNINNEYTTDIVHKFFEQCFGTNNSKIELIKLIDALNEEIINSIDNERELGQFNFNPISVKDFLKTTKRPSYIGALTGLISRLQQLIEEDIFIKETPSWLLEYENTIDLFVEDYSADREGIRLITGIVLQFLNYNASKPHYLIIDEAHQFFAMNNSESKKLISQLLRESRKYNIVVILITQNSSDLPDDLINLIDNQFQFREMNNSTTHLLPNQVCYAKLRNSNFDFIFRVTDLKEKIFKNLF